MRIAAFDLGSNSFHMIVVETRPDGSFTPVAKEREMLRLGDLVARNGELGSSAREHALEVIRRFKAIADTQHADTIIAVGTSALREAKDGPELVDAAKRKLGVSIHIIDGIQEATTIFTAIRSSVVLDPSPALALDLGGGSLELMLGDAAGLQFASTAKLGVGRLTAQFFQNDPPTAEEIAQARKHISTELAPILEEIREYQPKLLVGSSGTFIAIATIAAALRDQKTPEHINHLTVSYEDIHRAFEVAIREPSEERAKMRGADARRSDLLPAGFLVLLHVMEEVGVNNLTISGWALREGIVLTEIAKHDLTEFSGDPKSIRRASVLSLCHRCNWNHEHGFQVATLAVDIFDGTKELHHMGERQREFLEFAALMHDIGEHISRTNHDRHSAYLVEHGDLRGFTPNEIRMLAILVRMHLRGSNKALRRYGFLSEQDQRDLRGMIGILRVADALDSSHSDEITQVTVGCRNDGTVVLSLVAKNDAELELWSLKRKKDFFEEAFGVVLEPQLQRNRRRKLTALFSGESGFG